MFVGLSGSGRTPPPPPSPAKVAGANGHLPANYRGQVFIIKELDKDKAQYEAFVTNGGIQEVKTVQQQQIPSEGQSNIKDDEDSEYFAVLVTPETVSQLQFAKTAAITLPLSVLLPAISAKVPWLLVLRRRNYPQFFEYQPNGIPGLAAGNPAGLPAMQVPQRRRYYATAEAPTRQTRGLAYDDEELARIVPLVFEGELLSTMCYNFIRDYVTAGKLPRVPVSAQPIPQDSTPVPWRSAPIPQDSASVSPDSVQVVQSSAAVDGPPAAVPMTVPKRVSA